MTDEELSRLRRRTELALARARLAEETPHRERLLSVDDLDEITGRTAALLDEKLKDSAPDSVEVKTRRVTVRGKPWAVVAIVIVIAVAVLVWRLAPIL